MKILKFLLVCGCVIIANSSLTAQELSAFAGFLQNQYYQDDNRITKKEFNALLDSNPDSRQYRKIANNHTIASGALIGAQVGFLFWANERVKDRESATLPVVGYFGSAVAGLGFAFSAAKYNKLAILKYNASFDDVGTLNFGPTSNGLGLVLEF